MSFLEPMEALRLSTLQSGGVPPELIGGDAIVQHREAVGARLVRSLHPVVPPPPHCAPIVRPHL